MSPMLDAQPNLNDGALPMRTPTIIRAALAALTLTAAAGAAQQQPAVPPGTLALNGLPPGAREAFFAGIDARHNWQNAAAVEHFNRALQIDSTFGLARIFRLEMTSGTAPFVAAESRRAGMEGAGRPIAEGTYVSAMRGAGANTERLLAVTLSLLPNDRRIKLEHAAVLPGEERLDTLRALVRQYPDWSAPRMWLAFYLSNAPYTATNAERYESLVQAEAAMRQDPRNAATHLILGHALHRYGRFDEAAGHLQATTKLDPRIAYAYVLEAEIYARDGKPRAVDRARAAFDSAIAVNPNVAGQVNQRRERAFLLWVDGRRAQGLTELEAVAKEYTDAGVPGTAAVVYSQMAGLQAGCGDTTGVDKWIQEGHKVAPNANITIQAVQAYGLAKMGPQARRELTDFQRRAATAIAGGADSLGAVYRSDLHRLTGLTLLAEGNAAGALAELKRADSPQNYFADLGMMDAYTALGQKAEAAAIGARLAADKIYGNASISSVIGRCRAFKK